MMLLSVSTSGSVASAALMKDGALLALVKNESGLTHSETILPLCEALFAKFNLTADEVDAYAVDVGPGSFTGVRIGVCAVNAMAAATQKQVFGVCALDGLYESARNHTGVCSLIDAKAGKVYAAHYKNEAILLPPTATTIDELLPLMPRGTVYVGDGAAVYADRILNSDETAVILPEHGVLLADAVAFAGWRMLQNGSACEEALPLYLRPSQAERLRSAGKEQS